MSQIYFPIIGSVIKLTTEWNFRLYNEHRNNGLFELFGYENISGYTWAKYKCNHKDASGQEFDFISLPEETVLKVDRIYIRKGSPEFNSITFYAQLPNVKKKVRFWAKIVDINNKMIGEFVE